jgi:tripartite-type tricarboxylate transporter receptor subunit TctC
MRAITSSRRVPAVPDLPTMAEAGLPGYEFVAWLALFAPAKTPAPIVQKVAELTNAVVRSPGMLEYLARAALPRRPGVAARADRAGYRALGAADQGGRDRAGVSPRS